MKTLRNLEIAGALYQGGTGPEAQVGDQVKLFLDTDSDPGFPEFVLGIIQHPIVKIHCSTKTSYSITYDENSLNGAADALVPDNVIDVTITSSFDLIQDNLEAETAARLAASAAMVQTTSFTNSTGNTTITIPAGCEIYTVYGTFTGAAGTRIIILDTTNAVAAAEIRFVAILPTTAAIVLDVRNATAGGTQVDTLITDTSGDDAMFTLGFTTVWNKISTDYPN
jgi:hypothetical protein